MVIPAPGFDPVLTLQAVQDERCTGVYGVPTMFIAMQNAPGFHDYDLSTLRTAIRNETKIRFAYVNERGKASRRTVWPIALAFYERVRVLTAWCELRGDFRHFRTDRVSDAEDLRQRYPRRRRALLKEWREIENIAREGAAVPDDGPFRARPAPAVRPPKP